MEEAITGIDKISLGKTGIQIPHLGIGAWAWGDRWVWGYGQGGYTDQDIRQAYDWCIAAGVNFFDTAEFYGLGRSEQLLGEFLSADQSPAIIATKFAPYPWRFDRGALLRALRRSLERLKLAQVDLYQIHFPYSPRSPKTWAAGLADAVGSGLARAVGVSNFSRAQMDRTRQVLQPEGIPLASNQVEYHLLNRKVEKDDLLQYCLDQGVTLLAYSPLAQGILTGKYTPENPPPGYRGSRYNRSLLARIQPLIHLLHEIGAANGGKSPSQVALNWVICKGAVPIPGAKNARQAKENTGALGWRLSAEDIARLDEASDRIA